MRTVTLYSKPDCHLCDRAKAVIDRCHQKMEFTLEIVDISGNSELESRYGEHIPVILLDGMEIARHFVRENQLCEQLRKP